jgi:hypothetical protein
MGIACSFGLEEDDINKPIPQSQDQSATIYRPERSRFVSARLIRS